LAGGGGGKNILHPKKKHPTKKKGRGNQDQRSGKSHKLQNGKERGTPEVEVSGGGDTAKRKRRKGFLEER